MLIFKLKGVEKIDIVDLIFMGIPEGFVFFTSLSLILEKKMKKIQIFYMTLIYCILCYFIKNNLPNGISTIILFGIIITIMQIFSKVKFIRCVVATIITASTLFCLEIISVTFINIIGVNLDYVLNNQILKILIYYIPISIMFMLVNMFKYQKFIKEIDRTSKAYKSKKIEGLIFYISTCIITVVGIVVFIVYENKNLKYEISQFLMLFLMSGFVLILSGMLLVLINYNKRKALNEIQQNLMQNNLKQMEDTVDALRMQRHDYMNHLQVILMQVSSGKNEDARKYILGLSEDASSGLSCFCTGSSYMDAILNTKKRRALRYDIQLTACIDSILENIELSDSELSSVILNIIDNAIDELKKYDKEYKYIHVDIYSDIDYHNISIKNNGSKIKDVKKIFELGYSSKGKNRGFGLYSIKKLLESHKCNIEVYSDDMETEFSIQIPIMQRA